MDNINHPAHYASGKIEVIEFIEDKELGFNLGNAVKYIARAGKKDPEKEVEDLKKAIWYLTRQVELIEARNALRDPVRPNDMNKKPEEQTQLCAICGSFEVPAARSLNGCFSFCARCEPSSIDWLRTMALKGGLNFDNKSEESHKQGDWLREGYFDKGMGGAGGALHTTPGVSKGSAGSCIT